MRIRPKEVGESGVSSLFNLQGTSPFAHIGRSFIIHQALSFVKPLFSPSANFFAGVDSGGGTGPGVPGAGGGDAGSAAWGG